MPERFYTITEMIEIEGRQTTLLDELECRRSSAGTFGAKWVVRVERSDGLQIPFLVTAKDWRRMRGLEVIRDILERGP